jgi:hypothetical protein
MKPVCVPCRRFYRMREQGFYLIEGMPRSGQRRSKPGLEEPQNWKPYKVWVADLWECKGCGQQILSGFGCSPLSEHYREDFAQVVAQTKADQLQVNDC